MGGWGGGGVGGGGWGGQHTINPCIPNLVISGGSEDFYHICHIPAALIFWSVKSTIWWLIS